MVITPDQYASTPVYDLLAAASRGLVGVDQRLLRAIVDRGEPALDDIVRFGLEDRSSDRIPLDEDLVAIVHSIGSAKALPLLIEYLRREPDDPSELLIQAFQRMGADAIPALIDLYEELGDEAGSGIAFLLAALRLPDPRILDLLKRRAAYDPADAAFLMGVHGDPAARPLLLDLKQKAARDPELAARLGAEAEESLQLLDQDTVEEPEDSLSLWDLYPERIEPVFDILSLEEKLAFLRCPSAELRADCAASFIDRDVPPQAAAALLDLAEHDENAGVRSVASAALGARIDDPAIFERLMVKLRDASLGDAERCGALLAVAPRARQEREIRHYIEEFYSRPATMARAIEAMWRSMDRRYADVFRRRLDDADFDVRRQAVKGVGFLQLSSEAAKLSELMRDEEFRLDALFSYAMCVPIPRLARNEMPAVLKKIEAEAGGLSEAECEIVTTALDTRLVLNGLEPVFAGDETEET